jgi:hypothetical protein
MPVCLWKDCELVLEDMAAFQEHVITKHAQQHQLQQQKQLNLVNQNDVGLKEEEDHGGPMAKKAKMNEEEESKMSKRGENR